MKNDLKTLIKLIEDPDPEVYNKLSPVIMDFGLSALNELEKASRVAETKEHFERINHLIEELLFSDIKRRFSEWINSKGQDISYGINLINEVVNPDIHYIESIDHLKSFQNEIWLELNSRLTSLEKMRVINYFIYEKYNFRIADNKKNHPTNFSLSRLATERLGNGESLHLIYAIIARGLGLPVYGVHFPGLTLLAYLDIPFAPKPGFDPSQSPVLFFIHPANKGRILGIDDVHFFLSKFYPGFDNKKILACSDSILVKQFAMAIARSCKNSGKTDLEKRILELLALW